MKDFAAIDFETANHQRTSEGWRDCRQLLQPHQTRTGIDAEACAWIARELL